MKENFEIIQKVIDGAVKAGLFSNARDVCKVQLAIDQVKREVGEAYDISH